VFIATLERAETGYRSAPPRISNDLLIRGIAWQLQANALGGLLPSVQRELRQLVGAKLSPDAGRQARDAIRPGTQLLRTWGGRSWSVTVVEDGYVFEGRLYVLLSQIAREITGALVGAAILRTAVRQDTGRRLERCRTCNCPCCQSLTTYVAVENSNERKELALPDWTSLPDEALVFARVAADSAG